MADGVLNNGVSIQWLGHSATLITSPGGKRILIDPFIQSNPSCPPELHEIRALDVLLITHGHGDHMGDALAVIRSGQPKKVIAIHEIAVWLASKGVETTSGMNHGGTQEAEGIKVSMTPAFHSSSIDEDGETLPGGQPSGYVLELENGFRIYHAGDTALFGDMALIRELWAPDLAVLSIGDHFTMGPYGAAHAVRLLGVRQVLGGHWGTFPVLTGTPAALREQLAALGVEAEVLDIAPGETLG